MPFGFTIPDASSTFPSSSPSAFDNPSISPSPSRSTSACCLVNWRVQPFPSDPVLSILSSRCYCRVDSLGLPQPPRYFRGGIYQSRHSSVNGSARSQVALDPLKLIVRRNWIDATLAGFASNLRLPTFVRWLTNLQAWTLSPWGERGFSHPSTTILQFYPPMHPTTHFPMHLLPHIQLVAGVPSIQSQSSFAFCQPTRATRLGIST